MLIRDIILRENYMEDLVTAVQDLLVMIMNKEVKEISTEDFKRLLAKQGYVVSTPELTAAVDQSGFASSVDANKIIPSGELPDDLQQSDQDSAVDVGSMAGNQAMSDVKAGL